MIRTYSPHVDLEEAVKELEKFGVHPADLVPNLTFGTFEEVEKWLKDRYGNLGEYCKMYNSDYTAYLAQSYLVTYIFIEFK